MENIAPGARGHNSDTSDSAALTPAQARKARLDALVSAAREVIVREGRGGATQRARALAVYTLVCHRAMSNETEAGDGALADIDVGLVFAACTVRKRGPITVTRHEVQQALDDLAAVGLVELAVFEGQILVHVTASPQAGPTPTRAQGEMFS
jgi:hypothetical protein